MLRKEEKRKKIRAAIKLKRERFAVIDPNEEDTSLSMTTVGKWIGIGVAVCLVGIPFLILLYSTALQKLAARRAAKEATAEAAEAAEAAGAVLTKTPSAKRKWSMPNMPKISGPDTSDMLNLCQIQ